MKPRREGGRQGGLSPWHGWSRFKVRDDLDLSLTLGDRTEVSDDDDDGVVLQSLLQVAGYFAAG